MAVLLPARTLARRAPGLVVRKLLKPALALSASAISMRGPEEDGMSSWPSRDCQAPLPGRDVPYLNNASQPYAMIQREERGAERFFVCAMFV